MKKPEYDPNIAEFCISINQSMIEKILVKELEKISKIPGGQSSLSTNKEGEIIFRFYFKK